MSSQKSKFLFRFLGILILSLNCFVFLSTCEKLSQGTKKKISIRVEQSYGAKNVNLPIEDRARRLLEYGNLAVTNGKVYDYLLNIKMEGEALGAKYTIGYFDSGASLEGKIILEKSGVSVFETTFGGLKPVPFFVSVPFDEKDPFQEAFESSDFISKIFKVMDEVVDLDLVSALNTMLLEDIDPKLRAYAARALGRMNNQRSIDLLINGLTDKDEEVRNNSAIALGEIKDPIAVKPLIQALKYGDSSLQPRAAIALGEIGESSAIDPLISALSMDNKEDRHWVEWALKNITKKDLGDNQAKWKEWWDQNRKQSKK
jgi:hypothetical protein